MDVLFTAAGLFFMVYIFRIYGQRKKPVKTALINIFSGVGALLATTLILTALRLPCPAVNGVTCFISAVFGVPGSVLLVILGFILQ